MLFFRCQRVLAGAALVLLTLCATASEAVAKPKPGRGFRLFASAENIFTVNRVQCRVFSDRPDLRHGLVDRGRRHLAPRHREPVRLRLGHQPRRHHRAG